MFQGSDVVAPAELWPGKGVPPEGTRDGSRPGFINGGGDVATFTMVLFSGVTILVFEVNLYGWVQGILFEFP